MNRRLDRYSQKRDFDKTPEPHPQPVRKAREGAGLRFVVQRHEASRGHYDLRLEGEGSLLSWAVPKDLVYDPAIKRLAVRTEDHPLSYLEFEGVIPQGNYGAGTMQIFDVGTFTLDVHASLAEAEADGEIKLVLAGLQLAGAWHLVRTKASGANHWLLFKSKDRYTAHHVGRTRALGVEAEQAKGRAWLQRVQGPSIVAATADDPRVSDSRAVAELDYVGRRGLLTLRDGELAIRGMRRVPEALRALEPQLAATSMICDGVLTCAGDHGWPDAARLAAAMDVPGMPGVVFHAFDMLYWNGFDLRDVPLLERKRALGCVLPPNAPGVVVVDHLMGDAAGLLRAVGEAGQPGIVVKPADSAYRRGASSEWLRVATCGVPDAVKRAAPVAGTSTQAASVQLSNPSKVLWPDAGFKKRDLFAYYDRMADAILPHLAGRALHLLRYPDGIHGKSFYQRNPEGLQLGVASAAPAGTTDDGEAVLVCPDRTTLLAYANLASIDLHPWLSCLDATATPDVVVFDLDPKGAPFHRVVDVARALGDLLADLGLTPVVKTSGKTGLHVVLYVVPEWTYPQVRMFCEAVARLIVQRMPHVATVARRVTDRNGKVYIDTLQNARGQSVVAPWVVRPVGGATVSTPLDWGELDDDLSIGRFDLESVPSRFESGGDLFLAAMDARVTLNDALEHLDERTRGG